MTSKRLLREALTHARMDNAVLASKLRAAYEDMERLSVALDAAGPDDVIYNPQFHSVVRIAR